MRPQFRNASAYKNPVLPVRKYSRLLLPDDNFVYYIKNYKNQNPKIIFQRQHGNP
ncbi:Uncharacterized protein dnm_055720 [Desulfonema magnum]|uniref:Uncharacterized protein n=1 Tax=Desulfonema magnum TaxID=45655 RepID=A0A975GPZ5_9BACT|nr:Uncharacterized protein dnm_055720 [Desulfonema magnum]